MRTLLLAGAAALAVCTPFAAAQTTPDEPGQTLSTWVDVITVTGRPLDDEIVLDAEAAPALAPDAAALAARLPGAALIDNGALSGQVQYRGLFGPRVAVAINGQRFASGGPNLMDPPLHYAPAPLLDHNVAYVRVPAPPGIAGCAYSAYDATWTPSPVVHLPGLVAELISDNVVRLEDPDPAIRFEAFGARPALWATLGGDFVDIILDEDYTVVQDTTNMRVAGFSGLCRGMWVPNPTPSGLPTASIGAPDHMGYFLEGGATLHVFQPTIDAWTPPIGLVAGAIPFAEDAVCDVRGGTFLANASRWGTWNAGPATPAAPFATTTGGSVIAHQQLGGAGVGDIYVFDERCDMWPAPFNPGAVTTLTAGRNLLVSDPGAGGAGPVHGYSVQRGDWTTPGPIATPLAVGPTADENVAWLVDGSGRLWGFGSPNIGHVYYAWPNGTEYHNSGNVAGAVVGTPILGYSILGTPGVTGAFGIAAFSKIWPPLALPPILGLVCIDLTLFVNLGFFGVTDADCLREKLVPIPNPVGGCFSIWLQPLSFDFFAGTSTWEHRCDPAWFY